MLTELRRNFRVGRAWYENAFLKLWAVTRICGWLRFCVGIRNKVIITFSNLTYMCEHAHAQMIKYRASSTVTHMSFLLYAGFDRTGAGWRVIHWLDHVSVCEQMSCFCWSSGVIKICQNPWLWAWVTHSADLDRQQIHRPADIPVATPTSSSVTFASFDAGHWWAAVLVYRRRVTRLLSA